MRKKHAHAHSWCSLPCTPCRTSNGPAHSGNPPQHTWSSGPRASAALGKAVLLPPRVLPARQKAGQDGPGRQLAPHDPTVRLQPVLRLDRFVQSKPCSPTWRCTPRHWQAHWTHKLLTYHKESQGPGRAGGGGWLEPGIPKMRRALGEGPAVEHAPNVNAWRLSCSRKEGNSTMGNRSLMVLKVSKSTNPSSFLVAHAHREQDRDDGAFAGILLLHWRHPLACYRTGSLHPGRS